MYRSSPPQWPEDPTTPALAAAVSEAGGLGFLAAGYKSAQAVQAEIAAVRSATARPFGVNLFYPTRDEIDEAAIDAFARSLHDEEVRYGVSVGVPVWSDDDWEAKLRVVARECPDVVSFTFGCPERDIVEWLRGLDIAVWAHRHFAGRGENQRSLRVSTRSSCRARRPEATRARSSSATTSRSRS